MVKFTCKKAENDEKRKPRVKSVKETASAKLGGNR